MKRFKSKKLINLRIEELKALKNVSMVTGMNKSEVIRKGIMIQHKQIINKKPQRAQA